MLGCDANVMGYSCIPGHQADERARKWKVICSAVVERSSGSQGGNFCYSRQDGGEVMVVVIVVVVVMVVVVMVVVVVVVVVMVVVVQGRMWVGVMLYCARTILRPSCNHQ